MVISDFDVASRITQESADLKTICVAYYRFPQAMETRLPVKRWWMNGGQISQDLAKMCF